jgi:predicted O-methyltransferase YrrM
MTAFQIKSFLKYWLEAVDGHSLHSPFMFDLYEKVVRAKDEGTDFSMNERLRSKLLDNPTQLLIHDDFGANAKKKSKERTVKDIASSSLSSEKFSRLYARIARYQGSRNIIELGTSLGINSLYLASEKKSRVTTFEGSRAVAAVARSTFEFANASNIAIVEGNIDSTLPLWLEQHEKVDLAFMDANHRYEPTLKYFRLIKRRAHFKSVVILDDIHYTEEMEKAWNEILRDPQVCGSVDLYRSGLLFFDPSLNNQHVVLQF